MKTARFQALFLLFALVFFQPLLQAQERIRFRIGGGLTEDATQQIKLNTIPFEYNQDKWNEMRRKIEGQDVEEAPKPVQVSTTTVEPPKPPPGQISFELPYESSLSVTGRKVIKVELENKHVTTERAKELGTAQNTQSFNMEQELQAKIQGTVARKTTINVNFDDTKENVRDFSVIYKGDPDEVVQEAAFGDIVLSLPSTEFVNYNKQLFGIRTRLKYKKLGFEAIGSRTKGTTETKRFVGSSERKQKIINDTAYVRRKFYDLTFTTSTAMHLSTGPFQNGAVTILPLNDTAAELVLIEDNSNNPNASDFIIAFPTAPYVATTIRMRQMFRGVDYSIDRFNGIINFTNQVPEDARVAINIAVNDGTFIVDLPGVAAGAQAILIKDRTPETPESTQEIKRFYAIGDRNITPDNSLGNFTLRVMDPLRETELFTTGSPLIKYRDTIKVTFETGIFELDEDNLFPFDDVYVSNAPQGQALHAVFVVEYFAIKRTFILKPNIVLQSESITIDGRKLNRDIDYFIDYDIGLLTFFNDDLIRESTVIEATYEFAPFGGVLGETLVGARTTYDIFTNQRVGPFEMESWAAGSTVLYNFAAKPTGPPDIRSTPASLLVLEGDSQLKGFKWGKLPVTSNFAVEVAQSDQNPNLFGKALIDSMEGIRQEDGVSLLKDNWQVAANPDHELFSGDVPGNFNRFVDFRGRETATSHLTWNEIDLQTSDPNDGNASQKALQVAYQLNTLTASINEQVSLVQVISFAGRDFSKKTSLEFEVQGATTAGAGVELFVEYGTFYEDADGDNILDTEDRIPFDGILNLGEDVGFEFNGPGPDLSIGTLGDNIPVRVGSGNSRLDTEDLNNDRILKNDSDRPATFFPLFSLSAVSPQTPVTSSDGDLTPVSDLAFDSGVRKLFRIPINVTSLSAEEQARLLAVRQVRITIRNTDATTPRVGAIAITKLAIIGNSWQPAEIFPAGPTSTMTVTAINNKDDSSYIPLFGNSDFADLYKDAVPESTAREQALSLDYDLAAGATATTKNVYGASRDFSRHDLLKFFVQKKTACAGDCGQLFFQAGSETEYQQASINISDIPTGRWETIIIKQIDSNGDELPDTWVPGSPGVTTAQVGANPTITQISQLKIGVVSSTNTSIDNQIWVNDIHMDDPHERTGLARKYSFDTSWANWMDFGGFYRTVDRDFETPTTAVTNQDRINQEMHVNFNRLKFLPMSYKNTVDTTKTPAALRTNNNALVSLLEEGEAKNVNHSATARLLVPGLPIFDFAFDHNTSKETLIQRLKTEDRYRVGATYSPTLNLDLLPGKRLMFRPLPNSITVSYEKKNTAVDFSDIDRLLSHGVSTAPLSSTDLYQYSDEGEARLAFKPWDGFTFNPSYRLKVEKERRDLRDDEIMSTPNLQQLDNKRIPHAITQSLTASGSLRILKWLDPRYNYSLSGSETNKPPLASNATDYLLKTITRNGTGELSGTIQVNQIVPKFKPFQSMNLSPSYKIENGDTYSDMPNNFKWRNQLWINDPLSISSGTAGIGRRTSATARKTFRTSLSWQPFSGYKLVERALKPLSTLSVQSNIQTVIEDTENTGTKAHKEDRTWPDLILSISDTEDFFGISKNRMDNSRLTLKTNTRRSETAGSSKSKTSSHNADYLFRINKKYDVATAYNTSNSREDNLVTNKLTSKSTTKGYSAQVGFPWKVIWRFTPRYEFSQTDGIDGDGRITNDLKNTIYQLVVTGDLDKPLGLRVGRSEFGLTNRFILSSTLRWESKRSQVNPSSNYLDTYMATMSGDYTISRNFRLAIGGNFSQEKHHPDFKKLDQTIFGINSTLTIQF